MGQRLNVLGINFYHTHNPLITLISKRQKTVGCGPTYGGRACLPDPIDLWVLSYQKLRLEDDAVEEKVAFDMYSFYSLALEQLNRTHLFNWQMTIKKKRMLNRQHLKRSRRSSLKTTYSPPFVSAESLPTLHRRHSERPFKSRRFFPISKIDVETLNRTLDQLCHHLESQTFIEA